MHHVWLACWFLVKFLDILNFRCYEVALTSVLARWSLLLILLLGDSLLQRLQLICKISLSIFLEVNLASTSKSIVCNGTRLALKLLGIYRIFVEILRQGHRLGGHSRVLNNGIHFSFRLPEIVAKLKFLFVSSAVGLTFLGIHHGGQWKFLIMSLVHLLEHELLLLVARCQAILQFVTSQLLLLGNLRDLM